MGLWKPIGVWCEELDNLEFLKSPAASEALEAFHWDFAASGDELNELRSFTILELFQHLKEPLHNWGFGCVVLVHSVFFEVHNYKWLE